MSRDLFPHASLEAEAEAWAWRVADTIPDGAQSRLDALSDAETLQTCTPTVLCDTVEARGLCALRQKSPDSAAWDAYLAAIAAFRVCPDLRLAGERGRK